MYAISVDPPEVSRNFASKIASDGRGQINFPLLSDPGHKVIDAYGLHDPAYDGQQSEGIPKASVFVLDRNGVVTWARIEENYRQRPTNEQIRAALDALKYSSSLND